MEGFHRYHLVMGFFCLFVCSGKLAVFCNFLTALKDKKSQKCCNGFNVA